MYSNPSPIPAHIRTQETQLLVQAALLALFLKLTLLLSLAIYHQGTQRHPFTLHPHTQDDSYIEAQVFKIQPLSQPKLTEKTPTLAKKQEPLLSTVPNRGTTSPSAPSEEQNQTQEAPPQDLNHGPIALYAPPPVIPSYLHTQDLHAFVSIAFYISSQGEVTPELLRSSGDEELDAIALAAVQKWKFDPAVKDGQPINSKVALKIVFKVE